MIRILTTFAALLALAACGSAQEEGDETNAAAAANLLETLPNELADDRVSDANLANAAEAEAGARVAAQPAQPAPKAAPRAEPRRPAAPEAPPPAKAQPEPDPHAGHDMNNMSHD